MIWAIVLGAIWVIGWWLTIMALAPLQKPSNIWGQIKMMAEMFVIWPLLVWELANGRN